MKIALKITKGRAELVFHHPFFGAIALRLEMIEDDTINPPTMCVNGYYIKYHPVYVEEITEEEVTGVIAHEVLHVALLHHTRMGNRHPLVWNFACDYAVNWILVRKNDFVLPKGCLLDSKYSDMTAEAIYENLVEEINDNDTGEGIPIDLGDSDLDADDVGDALGTDQRPLDSIEKPPKDKKDMAEQDAKELANTGLAAGKQAGKMPGGLAELIDAAHEPQVNWKDRLRDLLQPRALGNLVWHQPYKRMLDTIYLPHNEKVPAGRLLWAIDTSASVCNKELSVYASELQAIMTDNHIESATMLQVDTKVQHVKEFNHDDELEFKMHGRGGTCFEPAFEWVEENMNGELPDALLYFTDGEATFPDDPPPYPVIWCITGKIQAPWGDTIELRF